MSASNQSLIRGTPADCSAVKPEPVRLSYSQITRTSTPRLRALMSAVASADPGVPLRL